MSTLAQNQTPDCHGSQPHQADPQVSHSLSSGQRVHYFDNLRALAMMLGVLLHAGLAYAEPARNVWIATDPTSSRLVDCLIWFVHLFRMALFFLIAGYFGKLLMVRHGARRFLTNRVCRIAVPFVLFWPVLLVAMWGAIVFGLSAIDQPQGILKLIKDALSQPDTAQASNTGETLKTMHLWFLYYLMMFSLLASALYQYVRWPVCDIMFRFPKLWLLAPLLLVPACTAGGTPLVAPESFVPTWWPFAFYGAYYWAGWQLVGRESILDFVQPWALPMAVAIGAGYGAYYQLLPTLDLANLATQSTTNTLIAAVLTAYLSSGLVVLVLWLGRRYLSGRSAFMRWIADASYWTYLIHLPIVVFLQYLFVEAGLNVWLKFSFVVLATSVVCGSTYVVFVRYTPVGWLLNGKRAFP